MTPPLRVVFAGTPDFAVPAFHAIQEAGHTLVGVYTPPDRRAGRGRKVTASPVKQAAMAADLPVLQPPSLRDSQVQAQLAALKPDVMVVVAYGQLLPQVVLDIPRLGCVNVHASLLPRWRGAAPIQRALLAGDTTTGITIMQMDAGLDTGAILAQQSTPIADDDTAQSLGPRLATLGARTLHTTLASLAANTARATAQPADGVSYAHKLKKSETPIDWTQAATVLAQQVRGLQPWPVADTLYNNTQLRLWRAQALDTPTTAAPGTVLAVGEGFDVATGGGILRVLEVQRAGRKRMHGADFAHGCALTGQVLG